MKPVYNLLEIKVVFDLPHKSIDLSLRDFKVSFPAFLFRIHPDPSTIERIQPSFQQRRKMQRKDYMATKRPEQER